jgi:protein-tyrosine-phosphatase
MTIHFICIGNVFRSRLAEAYLNSKQLPNIKVISSGVEATRNTAGPISWYAQRMIQEGNLIPFEKSVWDQTTRELLSQGDITIFMHQNVYDYCVRHIGTPTENYQIWEIPDIRAKLPTIQEEVRKIEVTEKIFEEIKQKVDELISNFNREHLNA